MLDYRIPLSLTFGVLDYKIYKMFPQNGPVMVKLIGRKNLRLFFYCISVVYVLSCQLFSDANHQVVKLGDVFTFQISLEEIVEGR